MGSRRTLWSLATGLGALAIVTLGAYAQAHGRWDIWDLLLAAPWPYLAYRAIASRLPSELASPAAERDSSKQLADAYRAAAEALASAVGA